MITVSDSTRREWSRKHRNAKGMPKDQLTKDEADLRARRLGCYRYYCVHCGWWHVGNMKGT